MLIYLDNSATTRQYNQVTEEMQKWMREEYGNPSSLHRMGLKAERGIRDARKSVAHSLGVTEEEIFFTGGGTEADNTAIFGAAKARRRRGDKIITTKVEHPAVLEACKRLEQSGFHVSYLNVNEFGGVNLQELEETLDDRTILVSVMTVNNELGTVMPIAAIGKLLQSRGEILFHSDGIQALGKVPIQLNNLPADLFSISGHKIHGPKGTGALYIRKGLAIEPYLIGGGQERGFRSGTENTPGVVGLGIATDIMEKTTHSRLQQLRLLRNYLLLGVQAEIPEIWVNSPESTDGDLDSLDPVGSPSILNISFLGCRGEVLLHSLEQEDIYVSTGAACSSRKKSSHVLTAANLSKERIEGAIRFSFSEYNTMQEMEYVLMTLKKTVTKMRKLMSYR